MSRSRNRTPAEPQTSRDPEDRLVALRPECIRDKMLDKTIADSFPTSDPPSTLPDPSAEDSFATDQERAIEEGLDLPRHRNAA